MAKATLEVGDNYSVELDAQVACCRVWSRPDLDFEAGARLAAKKVSLCRWLAAGTDALGMLFDLREAPKVTGPKTQRSLALILNAWESAARPIAIVVSPASIHKLQLTRIARDAAPTCAEVFVDPGQARAWVDRRLEEARRPPKQQSRVAAPAAELLERPAQMAGARAGSQRDRSSPPKRRV